MARDGLEVVLTGPGTPVPTPGRAGAGTCVRAAGITLQFDVGRATTLRLAEAGIGAHELDCVFLTHHHSDHVTGLPDLLMTAWLTEAEAEVPIVAPDGITSEFASHSLDSLRRDIEVRSKHRTAKTFPRAQVVSFPAPAAPTTVWQGVGVRVDAVTVQHQPVENAVAYRVVTPMGTVVISGDTRVCDSVEQLAQGARVMVHEVMAPERIPRSRAHTAEYHSAPEDLGAMADRAGVERLVLTHIWPAPASRQDVEDLAKAVRKGGFRDELVVGSDLTSISVLDGTGTRVSIPDGRGITGLYMPRVRDTLVI